jgi:hypothetical protein
MSPPPHGTGTTWSEIGRAAALGSPLPKKIHRGAWLHAILLCSMPFEDLQRRLAAMSPLACHT